MAEIYETEERKERVLLLGVDISDGEDVDASLNELEELVDTAGAETVGRMIQNREAIHPGTYIGKGKIDELRERIKRTQADAVICDDELSPAQLGNLQDLLEIKVIDRTVLILDIFAGRARTREGKLQIELAQLKYRSSRLIGLRSSLSRTGGASAGMGIGSKGPGEKKLELDRRLIKNRMTYLYRELKDVRRSREVLRKKRGQNLTPVVAIVGYTNAGKSTLLNTLTEAKVLEEDKLFATLDPTTRSYETENGQKFLFTDTVGFINKLPHHLIDAFRSTLEEAKYADLILHVVDVSNPDYEKHMQVVYDTLEQLEIEGKPVLTVFNKIDKVSANEIFKDIQGNRSIRISAKEGRGLKELIEEISEILNRGFIQIKKVFSYEDAGKLQYIRQYGQLQIEEYRDNGIYIEALLPEQWARGFDHDK